jgi:hypothetical protein
VDVVKDFEIVEIDEQQCTLTLAAGTACQGLLQPV